MQRMKWAVLASGFVAVVAQTLIIREALALFGGNELISGVILSFWLVWGGLGSLLFAALRFKIDPVRMYIALLMILCFFFAFSLCFIRIAPWMFNLPFGEVIDFGRVIFVSILTLAPTCIVFGALYPAASRILQPEKVYLFEGVGAFLGGVAVSFVLIHILPPFGIMLIAVVVLLCLALLLVKRLMLLFLPLFLLVVLFKVSDIEFFFRRVQMGEQDLIGLNESKYGVIAVTRSGDQYNFYTNGLYDFSVPDVYTSEEAVHYAMLLHASPVKVLLVGGGIGNSINQVLKHPSVQHVTYVELDPLLFDMAEKYTGKNLAGSEKLTVVFGDARYYVKQTDVSYDVIIINLPDPMNAQINRFYTQEFFAEARRILEPGGLLSVRIASPPNIVSPLFGQLLNTVDKSLALSFDNVIALPAAKTTFIATDYEISLYQIAETLEARIAERNLELSYVNPYYFDYNLSYEKLDYLGRRIGESKGYVNRDLKPVCYYFTSILWGGILSENVRKAFVDLFNLPAVFFLAPLLLLFIFYRRKSLVYVSVLAVGASEISAEVILIVLFQVYFGYLYGWVGAIIACYMLGLAAGTLIYLRLPSLQTALVMNLAKVEFGLGIYFAIMIAVAILQPQPINIIIPALVFIGGFMGGLHFPMSLAIIRRERAGLVYGIDLIGSSLGALVTAMVLIPILGIVYTLAIFLLMNCIVGVGLVTIKSSSMS